MKSQKFAVFGTAGHIDHGKSSLIRALTGIDPDRLKEEKKRGITIELGFAHLEWEDLILGIVDVPGHEKLVKTMAAGTSGIDFVLMVVAADEGVMPQTREHLEICSYLSIKDGIIALTKCDLVDEEWIKEVRDEIRSEFTGSFLEAAPIIEVSVEDGRGLNKLKEELHRRGLSTPPKPTDKLPRLATDRIFELKGIGLIAAGTLLSGVLKKGDTIQFLPSKKQGKIRTLQSYGREIECAQPGRRVALNISGIEKRDVKRGEWLVPPKTVEKTESIEVSLTLSEHYPAPLKHRAPALLSLGTAQIPCRIHLHAPRPLPHGQTAIARLILEEPTSALPGEPFILRGFQRLEGRGTTFAGGTVLDPYPKRKKLPPEFLEKLKKLYREKKLQPPRTSELPQILKTDKKKLTPLIKSLIEKRELIPIGGEFLFDSRAIRELKNRIVEHFTKNRELSIQEYKKLSDNISRKYLIPIAEYFDKQKLTHRKGSVRILHPSQKIEKNKQKKSALDN